MEAYEAGQRDFGENYVDELIEKAPHMPKDVRWHFIGHLQSNKVAKLLSLPIWSIHSVDSEKLAKKLDAACVGRQNPLRIFLQASTSDEETKSGLDPEELIALAQTVKDSCPRLLLQGLMTIGKEGDIEAFKALANLRDQVEAKLGLAKGSLELSMGMSADFEQAIAHGSNCVRVGSSIFGSRQYPTK